VHNWNAGGSIVSAAVIRKQGDADKRMLVNRLHVKCSECKNAITLLVSGIRNCDIAFEGVRCTARCNRTLIAAEI
jgi:hypothetical protein